jgi:WD40 repeat protein
VGPRAPTRGGATGGRVDLGRNPPGDPARRVRCTGCRLEPGRRTLAIGIDEGVGTWRRTGGAWQQEWSAGALVAPDADEDAPDVVQVAFAPDGRHLASGDKSGLVHVWDLVDGELRLLIDHGDWITGLAFAPDGQRLATAGEDGVVRLWDVPDGRARLDVEHGGPITGLAFSTDGRFASAGRDRTVRVWDAETGVAVLELVHPCTVWDVAFSPDGRRLATAARDRSVRLWDEAGGETILMRHGWSLLWGRSVLRVAFSPDGGVVASGGDDKTVRLWNAETGTGPRGRRGHRRRRCPQSGSRERGPGRRLSAARPTCVVASSGGLQRRIAPEAPQGADQHGQRAGAQRTAWFPAPPTPNPGPSRRQERANRVP